MIYLLIAIYFIHIPLLWIGVLYLKYKDKDLWSIADYFKLLIGSFIPIMNMAGICLLIDEGFFSWFTDKKY